MQLKQKEKIKKRQLKREPILSVPNYNPQLLKIQPEYTMQPSAQKIFAQNMITNGLKIKYKNTTVEWQGLINLKKLRLPLQQTLWLGQSFVEVYKTEHNKPKIGQQLNRPCVATFYSKKQLKYKTLEKICKRNGTNLMILDRESKTFTVGIPHFTKYQFEVKDDQSQQEKQQQRQTLKKVKTNNIPSQSSLYDQDTNKIIALDLVSKILERGNQSILSNKNIVSKTSLIPEANGNLLYEIDQSNRKNANFSQIFSYQFGFSTNGKPLKLVRRKKEFQIIEVPAKEFTSQKFNLEIFLKYMSNNRIDDYLTQHFCSLKITRIVSLLRICFYFPQINFTFEPNFRLGKKFVRRGPKPHAENQCQKVFNDWLQWTIIQNAIKLPKNHIYHALSIRQPAKLVQNLLRSEKFDDAQFLSCIEDQFYRFDTSQRKLMPQLQAIYMELNSFSEPLHWLVELGLQSWYFLKRTDFFDMLKCILHKYIEKVQDFYEQFRILQAYFYANRKQRLFRVVFDHKNPNIEDLIVNWYIAQELQKYQKHLFPSENSYKKYRLKLFKSILQKVTNLDTMLSIVKLEKYLEKDAKQNLLRDVLVNRKYTNDSLLDQQIEHMTRQSQAIFLLSQGKTLQALQKLKYCLPNTKIITKQYFLELCSKPEIIFNFKNQILNSLYRYIDSIIDLYPQLKSVYTFLSIRLGIRSPNQNNLTQICNLIQPMDKCHIKTATNLLFKAIQKNTLSKQWLKNESLCHRLARLLNQSQKEILQKMKTIARI